MPAQSPFMIAAAIDPAGIDSLRGLLATMNRLPGIADPDNALVPFGHFARLHFARIVILEDATLGDLAAYGTAFPDAPVYLAFLGDCDGDGPSQLAEFATRAETGLRRIFAHCRGFDAGTDLLDWMQAHSVAPAANYVNWAGRSLRQVREERALHDALSRQLAAEPAASRGLPAIELRARLVARCRAELPPLSPAGSPLPRDGRLALRLGQIGLLLALLVLGLVLLPLLVPFGLVYLAVLRGREKVDPVIVPRPDAAQIHRLSRIEDHDVCNPFSAFGNIKPGRFRLYTLIVVLWFLDFANRVFFSQGHLARVGTIHFARWVFLDDKRRVFFASNYDGALESYMDDFINKASFGLNLVFSNGAGYPASRYLILGGAENEQQFKYYLRRRQLPTEVWYNANPGLTCYDLARNTAIRAGFERADMTEAEARQWLSLI